MPTIINVLIHPSNDERYGEKRAVWARWRAEGARVVNGGEGLIDTSYVTNLPDGSRVILGGQEGNICVDTHGQSLVERPELRNGKVSLSLSKSATYGGEVGKVAKTLSVRLGKKVTITE